MFKSIDRFQRFNKLRQIQTEGEAKQNAGWADVSLYSGFERKLSELIYF